MLAPRPRRRVALLSLAALGVVFGDIGTSPLYAFRLCFFAGPGYAARAENVLGILSLIVWALILVVCIKYATFVLRADFEGEGGTLALLALLLAPIPRSSVSKRLPWFAFMLLLGAAMLYGDGVITPAISVLSAVEGLNVATTAMHPIVVPVTVVILAALFFVQVRGTGQIGSVFGPIMLLWFLAIGAGGLVAIVHEPRILLALDPRQAAQFIMHNGPAGIFVLGAVVLSVSGVEALYADLGHFGCSAIRLAWYAACLPALLLNYFGQGALVLRNPQLLAPSSFYALYPGWTTLVMVALSTVATVIASQALITGAFSMTQEAVQLGYLPRVKMLHTSSERAGQIFIPAVNAMLACACIAVVLGFRSSERLGSAYGLAVTVTMLATSCAFGQVARFRFKWPSLAAYGLSALFLCVDLSFFAGNIVKVMDGAWLPASIALAVFTLFVTWESGRRRVAAAFAKLAAPLDVYEREERPRRAARVTPETAVFLTTDSEGIPFILRHEWLSTHVLHDNIVIITIAHERRPTVRKTDRIVFEQVAPDVTRISACYGYMQMPSIDDIIDCSGGQPPGLRTVSTYYLPHPRLVRDPGPGAMPGWQRIVYAFMARNATPLTESLGLPIESTIEFGVRISV
jgi:KUP system potassium uptake protein